MRLDGAGRALRRLARRFGSKATASDRAAWQLSPYPAGKTFAFTIIHDADSGYSQRLAPVMEALDAVGFKITVTVFPFWAEWASGNPEGQWRKWLGIDPYWAPVAVPLEDANEREFYLGLRERGHEIALHTPAETSSVRADVERAFDYFEQTFGSPARMYVEHSPGNNLDAQSRSGSDKASKYFNTDLLNRAGCWVWVCDEETDFPRGRTRQLDVLSDATGPFSPRAHEKYGIERGFIRSRILPSTGDGFVAAFTSNAIAALERDGGTALAYAHLAIGWLDPQTRRLRGDIEAVLRAIAARDPWSAPGSDTLDRLAAFRAVELRIESGVVEVRNHGDGLLTDVSIRAPQGSILIDSHGQRVSRWPSGLLALGDLPPRSSACFDIARP
jgi:hypothetical protein